MSNFTINAGNFEWINGLQEDPQDLCLHGTVTAVIGNETFTYHCTVSSTALYLLKTLTQNHEIGEENQMLPCCGHYMIANEELSEVSIYGCPNGIDWAVIHEGDFVRLITESGKETLVSMQDYMREALAFADEVEAFYQSCAPKTFSDDAFEKNNYTAFWNEWHRRRCQNGCLNF